MFLGFREMRLEASREILVGGCLCHFGQGLGELLLRAVEVFQFVNVEIFESI